MGTVCLQCGDEGFTNAFVYCVNCLDVAVHRYCLPNLPKTFDEFVRWSCDDCVVDSAGTAAGSELIRSSSIDKLNENATHPTAKTGIEKSDGRSKSSLHIAYDKLDSREDAQFLGDECHSCGADLQAVDDADPPIVVAKEQGSQICSSQKIHEPQGVDPSLPTEGTGVVSASSSLFTVKGKSFKRRRKKKTKKRSVSNWITCFNCQQVGHYQANCPEPKKQIGFSSPASRRENGSSKSTISEQAWKKQVSDPHFPNNLKKDVSYSEADVDVAGHMQEAARRKQEAVVPVQVGPSFPLPEDHERAKPLINPIWRGSFNIINNNDDPLEGFVGHLSSNACQQVFDEACIIPPLLHMEMLPKLEVWPRSFQRAGPTDEHVALYFFPADRRYERTFDRLVEEMSHREFGMRASVKNADLLIFTSTELPLGNWRFQNKYYLWGVFRAKQAASSHAVTNRPGMPPTPSVVPTGIGIERTLRRNCTAGDPLSPVSKNGKYVYGNF